MSDEQVRPISRREYAFWILAQLAPGSAAAHLTVAFRTDGPLRWWPLQAAANRLLALHPALRSRFPVHNGVPVRELIPADDAEVLIDVVAATREDLPRKVHEATARPFDLATGPPYRVTMFQLAEGGSAVATTVHHIVADAVSLSILTGQLAAAYDAYAADREPDLAAGGAAVEVPPSPSDLRYWVDHLDGFDPRGLDLPWAGPRPSRPTFAGRTMMIPMPGSTADAVDRLRRRLRTTENQVLLSAFYLTLFRHGAGPDLVVGVPMSTRTRESMSTVGFGVSTVPLRVRLAHDAGFEELSRQVRESFAEAMKHARASVEVILAELGHRSTDWRTPIFRHLFNYRPWDETDVHINGERPEFLELLREESRLDLDLTVIGGTRPPLLGVNFSTEVHREDDVRAFVARMCALIEHAAADPDRPLSTVDMLTAAERAVVDASNATAAPETVADTVLGRFRAVRPDTATAAVTGDGNHSYADLRAAADRIAAALRSTGVRRGAVVGLALGRGAAAAAAMLGVWAAGGAFLPLDTTSPERRLRYLLDDAGVDTVIVAGDETAPWAADRHVIRLAGPLAAPTAPSAGPDDAGTAPDPDDAAYLMYTSGSTGEPKAVLVTHRNLANVVASIADRLGLSAGDATLWSTSMTFDISLLELFVPLTTGGRVVVAIGALTDVGADELLDLVVKHDVRLVQGTATFWRLVAPGAGSRLRDRTVICGGEPLAADLAADLLRTGCRLFNAYGPTETTIWSTMAEIDRTGAGPVPIGRPLANTSVFVAGRYGEELGCGLVGELCIAGLGVSAGYLGRPELTAERFGDHPVYGRFYRTGDLARWRPDGVLECLGRVDRQVKLRGQRIELEEIEAVLRGHGAVADAAVVVDGDPQGDGELRAFVRCGPDAARVDLIDDVWRHLRQSLPTGALPSGVTVVAEFPMTANGKLDHAALLRSGPVEAVDRPAAAGPDNGPDTDPDLTARLTDLWRESLGRPGVGPDDNFFLNGGHSLRAMRLATRVGAVTGRVVPVRAVFDHPTVHELVRFLTAAGGDDATR